MTRIALLSLLALTACTNPQNGGPPTGGTFAWPVGLFSGVRGTEADRQRRGAVELAVKSGFPAILSEIQLGTGPRLDAAFDAAGVPLSDRPTRLIQMQSDLPLYTDNPGALVLALLVYGG
jgi:hypothetical protein